VQYLSLPVVAFTTALVSFCIAQLVVLTAHRHGHLTMDLPGAVQKFHQDPTPRIGGIGIYIALVVAWACAGSNEQQVAEHDRVGRPTGFVHRVAGRRNEAGERACPLAGDHGQWRPCRGHDRNGHHAGGHTRNRFTPRFLAFAVLFTAFCVGGVSNAFNIIDGFHGLSGGTLILSSLGVALVASTIGDTSLAFVAVAFAVAVAGFWLVNFPWGKLFLGDGGAYFSGFRPRLAER
jgi:UDP-N-acetylmuramyl pentapeptide phosphotransferase/UDP-N-acetylglucosamine-1-phosphate transferase